MVVMEVETSTMTGSPPVGMPTPIGLGENTPRVPPNGATLLVPGAEDISTRTRPSSATRRA
ncbi:hypothetical protein Rta_33410 [Ramlibacter tataouinensis TTB310]|uniref:Uncharacterized protein n=1 Tax=Ramlibacter tataouinensis (strain ATCC BAA-407 / DSM 14655 / LMG 21543 / TTB310) TaxID=365046 RepID=F5XYT7_RAMTT|nr:hypothetical protein Rta_33410 [Ramlibacter tataouinensis TTB310]